MQWIISNHPCSSSMVWNEPTGGQRIGSLDPEHTHTHTHARAHTHTRKKGKKITIIQWTVGVVKERRLSSGFSGSMMALWRLADDFDNTHRRAAVGKWRRRPHHEKPDPRSQTPTLFQRVCSRCWRRMWPLPTPNQHTPYLNREKPVPSLQWRAYRFTRSTIHPFRREPVSSLQIIKSDCWCTGSLRWLVPKQSTTATAFMILPQ